MEWMLSNRWPQHSSLGSSLERSQFEKASEQKICVNSGRVFSTDIKAEKTGRITKKVSCFDSQEKSFMRKIHLDKRRNTPSHPFHV